MNTYKIGDQLIVGDQNAVVVHAFPERAYVQKIKVFYAQTTRPQRGGRHVVGQWVSKFETFEVSTFQGKNVRYTRKCIVRILPNTGQGIDFEAWKNAFEKEYRES